MQIIRTTVAALFVSALLATSASDADAAPSDSLTQIASELKVAKRGRDGATVRAKIDELLVLHTANATDRGLRRKAIQLIGSFAKSGRNVDQLTYVLRVLGETGDERAAPFIKKWLKQTDRKASTPVLDAAVAAASQVSSKKLHRPLLQLVDDSLDARLAASALRALGGFRGSAKDRAALFFDMVKLVRRTQPGKPNGYLTFRRGAKTKRWMALSGALVRACAMLIPEADFANVQSIFDVARNAGGNAKKLIP